MATKFFSDPTVQKNYLTIIKLQSILVKINKKIKKAEKANVDSSKLQKKKQIVKKKMGKLLKAQRKLYAKLQKS